jgi:hypothetical protein
VIFHPPLIYLLVIWLFLLGSEIKHASTGKREDRRWGGTGTCSFLLEVCLFAEAITILVYR